MSKKTYIIFFVIIIIVIFVLLYFFLPINKYKMIKYKENNKFINNPSRGYYRQISSEKPHKLDDLEDDIRLVFLEYDIKDFKTIPISNKKLDEIDIFIQSAAEKGIKIIFRAAYGFDKSAAYNDINDIEQLKKHIHQISTRLNRYKDNILAVQAGFLGPWGEWHSSQLLDGVSEEKSCKIRNEIIKTLLNELDKSIIINLRRPSFILDAQKNGIDIKRLGTHNDALLASDSDMGTYKNRINELEWCNKNISTGVNGGETAKVSDFSVSSVAKDNFEKLKLTYLNKYYNEDVLKQWKDEYINGGNAYDYITNHMGYRFYITSIKYSEIIEKRLINPSINFSISMNNSGFANIEQGYKMNVVIKLTDGSSMIYPIKYSLENLNSNGNKSIDIKIRVDPKIEFDKGKIGIQLVDADLVEKYGDKYTIELANDFIIKNGINYIFEIEKQNRNYRLIPEK